MAHLTPSTPTSMSPASTTRSAPTSLMSRTGCRRPLQNSLCRSLRIWIFTRSHLHHEIRSEAAGVAFVAARVAHDSYASVKVVGEQMRMTVDPQRDAGRVKQGVEMRRVSGRHKVVTIRFSFDARPEGRVVGHDDS